MQWFKNGESYAENEKYLHHRSSQLKVPLTLKEGQGIVLGLEPI
jgi:hypothetical protein